MIIPTYFALGYFYVYLDYFYPKGGTGALNALLREKIEQWGGKIQLNTPIVGVVPSESRIVDAEGHSIYYDPDSTSNKFCHHFHPGGVMVVVERA